MFRLIALKYKNNQFLYCVKIRSNSSEKQIKFNLENMLKPSTVLRYRA